MRLGTLIMAAGALAAGPAAWSQEAIATAANAPGGGAPPAASTTPVHIVRERLRDDSGPLPVGPCGGVAISKDGGPPKPDKSPHGEVWGAVGTHRYREAGGAVCIPLGDSGALHIAVDAARYGRR
jgi:hypothetical protein